MAKAGSNIDHELIAKYLAGEASDTERAQVEGWMEASEANRTHFSRLKLLWEQSGRIIPHENAPVNVDKGWERFRRNAGLQQPEAVRRPVVRSLYTYFVRVAAMLVVGVSVYLLYRNLKKPEMKVQTLATASQVKTDTLSDGTLITLNTNSQLTYPDQFADKEREVALKGEAFFKVAPNAQKPFRITAGQAVITVVGTSFYVEAYDSLNTLEVGVEEGKVKVSGYNSDVLLVAGQKITIDTKSGEVASENRYDANSLYWKSHALIFQNQPLANVFLVLEDVYHITIDVKNPRILHCRLSGKFYEQPVDRIFEIIDTNFGLTSERHDQHFTITGKGCD